MTELQKIDYKIIKSKNYKKITISIKRSQKIVVSSPTRISDRKINEFVESNRLWILRNLNKLEQNIETKKHTYLEGDSFLFFGEKYDLIIFDLYKEGKRDFAYRDDKTKELIIYTNKNNSENIKKIIFEYYKKETYYQVLNIINSNMTMKEHKTKISKLKVQKSNTRWGSCSSKNNINFSFRLIMLPKRCIEYVIFHEVAHINVKDHSSNFYKELESLCPNYKVLENEIKYIEKTYNISLA